MKLYSENENYKLYQGNMLDMLEVIKPESIDSIVTDPPYGLTSITKRFDKENSSECQYGKDGSFARLSRGFMGKEWDGSGIEYNIDTWKKCYEVLKPGGYLLAFGGSRTFHRIACAIEDAGFEIRDTIMWLYGSGFPKSMDISKQLDKRNGKQNEDFTKFGNYIKQKREEKGFSKNDIDKMMGTNTAYAWWEGRNYLGDFKVQLPDKENYYKLKKLLELDDKFDYLIEWQEAEREVIGTKKSGGASAWINGMNNKESEEQKYTGFSEWEITIPSTDLAKQWQGWGTALKPSFEPIIVARKPFKGSLVDNVIEYGVGGINIDECRVGNEEISYFPTNLEEAHGNKFGNGAYMPKDTSKPPITHTGRFPANTILTYDETDFDEVCGNFPYTKSGGGDKSTKCGNTFLGTGYGGTNTNKYEANEGSASRYFYCAKASKRDRDEGLDTFIEEKVNDGRQTPIDNAFQRGETLRKNTHPTVKPTDLMQYLVRLVSPNGATILDPFNGSGSTGKAVMYENKERNKNYKYIGIELTEEYLPIAKARIEYVCNLKPEVNPQMTIFDMLEGKNNE